LKVAADAEGGIQPARIGQAQDRRLRGRTDPSHEEFSALKQRRQVNKISGRSHVAVIERTIAVDVRDVRPVDVIVFGEEAADVEGAIRCNLQGAHGSGNCADSSRVKSGVERAGLEVDPRETALHTAVYVASAKVSANDDATRSVDRRNGIHRSV
jgi:hypothetical protein